MIWLRVIAFAAWTALIAVLMVSIAFFTLMGDCPEHVIAGWHGGTACSDQKHVMALLILFGFPLLWVLGMIGIIRFRRR